MAYAGMKFVASVSIFNMSMKLAFEDSVGFLLEILMPRVKISNTWVVYKQV